MSNPGLFIGVQVQPIGKMQMATGGCSKMDFEMKLTWCTIYHFGLVFWLWMFYRGAKRGKSKNPEIWATVFAALWPLTMITFFWELIKSFKTK